MEQTGPQASAVIVRKGPRILGFVRERDGYIGLPCGIREPGETPEACAIRETREETGLDVELTSDPYIGFDPIGGNVVATYTAKIIGEGEPITVDEGHSSWVGVRELLDGGYGNYNRRALRHFGIDRPLSGHFHSHLTMKCTLEEAERAQALVGGKVTVIELERAKREQVDVMLTHYYVVSHRGLDDHYDVIASLKSKASQLGASGIDVTRVKLEHELLHPKAPPEEIQTSLDVSDYIEVHVKCRIGLSEPPPKDTFNHLPERKAALQDKLETIKALVSEEGWYPSRNPRQQEADTITQFVNRRFYGERDLAVVEDNTDYIVALLAKHCEIAEVKLETAIYDDNGDLDRWWMA